MFESNQLIHIKIQSIYNKSNSNINSNFLWPLYVKKKKKRIDYQKKFQTRVYFYRVNAEENRKPGNGLSLGITCQVSSFLRCIP